MTSRKVVVPADDPIMIAGSSQLGRLDGLVDVAVHEDFPADPQEHLERVADAEIVVNSRNTLKWPASTLEQCPQLKMMTTCSIGVDAIDLEAAARLGIVVSNVPGRTATVVAEHALALMLGIARRLAFTTAKVKAGEWLTPDNYVLNGRTLGVIGAGAIGREMLRLGGAIGMKTQVWTFNATEERSRELGAPFVDLDTLLATSNVISIHVKLTEQSRHLVGPHELGLMKPGSFLVNTARGAVVDNTALVAALNSGHLAGAALDVFAKEPLPADDPICDCEHVILTPHTADQNTEGRDLLNSGAIDNILAYLDGKPRNVVT
ncbi:MAG: hypothetical protein CMJ64_11310 [Planctomycetaceae bacterium]|nr:hypothetical protein [Planctomycetaceae bacterium]